MMANRLISGLMLFAAVTAYAAAPPEKTFELAITHGAVPKEQRLLRVDKGTRCA